MSICHLLWSEGRVGDALCNVEDVTGTDGESGGEWMQGGWTALHWASQEGHSDVAGVLLEKGGGADLAKIQDEVRTRVYVCVCVSVSVSVCLVWKR